MPWRAGRPDRCVTQTHGKRKGDPGFMPRVTDKEREATPPAFAAWLVGLARWCHVGAEGGKKR